MSRFLLRAISAIFSAGSASLRILNNADGEAEDMGVRRRLTATMLFGPLILAAAAIMLLTGELAPAMVLALICLCLAIAWTGAALVVATQNFRAGEIFVFLYAATATSLLLALSGGLTSAALPLVFALPIEAYWITRRRSAAIAGLAAAMLIGAGQYVSGDAPGDPGLALWLVAVSYAASVAARFDGVRRRLVPESLSPSERDAFVMERMAALVIEFDSGISLNYAGPRACEIAGVEPAFLMGTGFFDRIHVADRVEFLSRLAAARESREPATTLFRMRVPCAEPGHPDPYEKFSAEFIPAASADRVCALIRREKRLEALQQELYETREKAAGNEIAKNRFLAAVSHELRTPLNAIIGFSDILLQNIGGDALKEGRQREYIELVRQSGEHLLSVVNAILDVSKIEAGSYSLCLEPFEFRNAANMCRAMLEPQAEMKKVRIHQSIPESLPPIMADRRAVQQILINLLSNAIKFTPENGKIDLEAFLRDDNLVFAVTDTGIGISQSDLQGLGQPFVQVQNDYTRNYEGTGLGLSLVKGLVQLHGGTMVIDSVLGEGTIVTVRLPLRGPARHSASGQAETAGDRKEKTGVPPQSIRQSA